MKRLLKEKALEKVSCDCFELAKQAIEEYLLDIQAYKRSMA
jgi:histone H3/H4